MTASGTWGKTTGGVGTVKRTAALREASAAVVQCLYRLVKGCLLHTDASNESVTASSKAALDAIADCCRHGATDDVTVLFMGDAVFVNGAILRTSREAHAIAIELGTLLGSCNVKELTIARTIGPADVTTLGTRLADVWRDRSLGARFAEVTIPGITVSAGKALDDEVEDNLKPSERVARTYAAAVLSVRGMLADVQRGEHRLPRRIKRVAQKIVAHADEDARLLVSLASQGGPAVDPSVIAVGAAILTVAMARQLTTERVLLSNAAMAALLFDAGRARLGAGVAGVARKLNEDELDSVPASSMVIQTAMGKLHPPARMRGALVYEAWHQRRAHRVGVIYRGRRNQTVLSRILGVARAFCELRAAGPEGTLSIDDAIQVLMNRATDTTETAFVRLLVGALGIYPAGTMVELNTGELAVVMATPALPIDFVRPPVKVMYDRDARLLAVPFDLDLAALAREEHGPGVARFILKAVNADDQQLKAMRAFVVAATAASRRASVVRDPVVTVPLDEGRPAPDLAAQAVPTARPSVQLAAQRATAPAREPTPAPPERGEPRRPTPMGGPGSSARPVVRRETQASMPRVEVPTRSPSRELRIEVPVTPPRESRFDFPVTPAREPIRAEDVATRGQERRGRSEATEPRAAGARADSRADLRLDAAPVSRRGLDPRIDPDDVPPSRDSGARGSSPSDPRVDVVVGRRPTQTGLPRTEPDDPRVDVVGVRASVASPERRPSYDRLPRVEALGGRPIEGRPIAGRPIEGRPIAGRPIEGRPIEGRPIEGRPIEGRPIEGRPIEGRPIEGRPIEGRPIEGSRPSQDHLPRIETPAQRLAMTPEPPRSSRAPVEAPAPTPPPWEPSKAPADRTNQVSWQEYAERLSKPAEPTPTPPLAREPTPPPMARREPTPPPMARREPTPPPMARREPTPPPMARREPTPPPMVRREPTPPPMAPDPNKTPVPRRIALSRTDSTMPPPPPEPARAAFRSAGEASPRPLSRTDLAAQRPLTRAEEVVAPARASFPEVIVTARPERTAAQGGDRTSQVNWEQYTDRLSKAARPEEGVEGKRDERDELLAAFLAETKEPGKPR